MPEKCIVIFSDGLNCSNFKSPQYIDYCYTCGKAGRRKDCIVISKGKKCPRKVKKGDYCGHHKYLGIKSEIFMDIEIIETIIESQKELNLKDEMFQYIEYLLSSEVNEKDKQKRDKLLIIKHPELIAEWDFKLNQNVDIKNITYGMNIYAYWRKIIAK